MVRILVPFLIIFSSSLSLAQHPEEVRLRGFAQHQKEIQRYDRSREKGENAYLEELEQWELQRLTAIAEHKKQKKVESPVEGGKEWQEDQIAKRRYDEKMEEARQVHVQKRDRFDRSKNKSLPSEELELGLLDPPRPRYDLKKRASFGAPSKYGSNKGSSSGGGKSSSYGGSSSSGGGGFPSPPPFNDFNDDNYVPAPNLGEYDSGGDFAPPPPPPPFTDGGEFPEFPPPPPPPDFGDSGTATEF